MALRDLKIIDGDLLVKGKIVAENGHEVSHGDEIKLNDLQLVNVGNVLKSVLNGFKHKHIHLLLEYETDGVHYGTSVDLHPYNNSICLSFYIIANETLTAYIDEEGYIVLSNPNGITPTNIEAHYFEYK